MRIVMDLQGAQATGSVDRGIGRYSLALARAMIALGRGHAFWLVLNDRFPESIVRLRREFDGLMHQERIRVLHLPKELGEHNTDNLWRNQVAMRLREAFIVALRPDLVHISSLFEGQGTDAVTSIGLGERCGLTAVTLYDLIPYVYPDKYLTEPLHVRHYAKKLKWLRRADMVLAISEHSRREAIKYLSFAPDRIVNIGAGIETTEFNTLPSTTSSETAKLYGITKPFILYVGGLDWRKNVAGVIEAFSLLPSTLQERFQLVLTFKLTESHLRDFQEQYQPLFAAKKILFTGYIPDAHLADFYRGCELFVFPSFHEGFGIPILEAMACGAPVIGSHCTSIPEVIGCEEALFDPASPQSIADAMQRVLCNASFAQFLKAHAARQSVLFDWEKSAVRALELFEKVHAQHSVVTTRASRAPARLRRLALVSPLPPQQTGIAAYSDVLLCELQRYYEVTVVVEATDTVAPWIYSVFDVRSASWFRKNTIHFDVIVYQIGNSSFHAYMYDLIKTFPGVVDLHDVFLSGLLHVLDTSAQENDIFRQALYDSHGYLALIAEAAQGRGYVMQHYPCSWDVIAAAAGLIVHSGHAVALLERYYGKQVGDAALVLPMLHATRRGDKLESRAKLGIAAEDFVCCSFGRVAGVKAPLPLLQAWIASSLPRDSRARLFYVGPGVDRDCVADIQALLAREGLASRVVITGFVPDDTYGDYLLAADVAVQLRTQTRGETSKALHDCLAHGLPTITNGLGSLAEFPESACFTIAEACDVHELTRALETVHADATLRNHLSQKAKKFSTSLGSQAQVGARYVEAIERFARQSLMAQRARLVAGIRGLAGTPSEQDLRSVAMCIYRNQDGNKQRQVLVDLPQGILREKTLPGPFAVFLQELFESCPAGSRIEPVAFMAGAFVYAHRAMMRFFNLDCMFLRDEFVVPSAGDVFIGLEQAHYDKEAEALFSQWSNSGVEILLSR